MSSHGVYHKACFRCAEVECGRCLDSVSYCDSDTGNIKQNFCFKTRRKKSQTLKNLFVLYLIKVFFSAWKNVKFTIEYHFYRLRICCRIIILYSYNITNRKLNDTVSYQMCFLLNIMSIVHNYNMQLFPFYINITHFLYYHKLVYPGKIFCPTCYNKVHGTKGSGPTLISNQGEQGEKSR